jgi:hypothetical protein
MALSIKHSINIVNIREKERDCIKSALISDYNTINL